MDVECACCYLEYPVQETTQCGNNLSPHRFCLECARKYAETEIGHQRTQINCIHESGCKAAFPETEIRRFLEQSTIKRLSKLRTEKELRDANLDGIVYCPFCPFAAIMDDPTDRIFECLGCGVASCRYCRVKNHHPLSCERYQIEKDVDAKHAIDEAMTEALLRNCNKCNSRFIKEDGCNKMTCPCGNLQCYICSQNITGYDHFGKGKCPQYDNTKERHRREVAAAQERAVQNFLERRGNIKEDDIMVDRDLMEHAERNDERQWGMITVRMDEAIQRPPLQGEDLQHEYEIWQQIDRGPEEEREQNVLRWIELGRPERERAHAELRARERAEQQEREQLEAERREREQAELREREQAERREREQEERREREQAERREREQAERRERERLEVERRVRNLSEVIRREKERQKAKREQRERERLERERQEVERQELERLAEQRQRDRREVERREREQAERWERERLERERLEAERQERERLEVEQWEKEQLDAMRRQEEQHERERPEHVWTESLRRWDKQWKQNINRRKERERMEKLRQWNEVQENIRRQDEARRLETLRKWNEHQDNIKTREERKRNKNIFPVCQQALVG